MTPLLIEMREKGCRETFYNDIENNEHCLAVYLSMAVLSATLAMIGLHHNSFAMIIAGIAIAPFLRPNVALALGTASGDFSLLRRALPAALAGIVTLIGFSVIIGAVVDVDPALSEVASRTQVGLGDIALALVSGSACALIPATGMSGTVVGMAVSLALVPPLITFGLLLGGEHPVQAMGALALFLVSLICIQAASVFMFRMRGVRPATRV